MLLGAALLGYGGWLLLGQVTRDPGQLGSLGAWFLAGPPVHDVLLAPVVAGGGLLVARTLPWPWRGTVAIGAVVSAALVLVAVPVLIRPAADAPDPGLHDRPYLTGLLIFLAVFWGLLLASALSRIARDQRRGRW